MKGSGTGENDIDIADIEDNIIYDDVKTWLKAEDATYEQKDYYLKNVQTKNLSPTGESAYLSTIIDVNNNSKISYLLKSFIQL